MKIEYIKPKVFNNLKETRVFNNLQEMKRYYDEETNSYIFKENGKFINEIIINFDLNVEANIEACDIKATSITVKDMEAWTILAWNINACGIDSARINAGVIQAIDIKAIDIKSMNIYARDIKVYGFMTVNIYARDIVYATKCIAYGDFKCNSIKCELPRPSHYTFYGKLEVAEDED